MLNRSYSTEEKEKEKKNQILTKWSNSRQEAEISASPKAHSCRLIIAG